MNRLVLVVRLVTLLGGFCAINGCAQQQVPPPEDAARAYAEAIEREDVQTLHSMMTEEARQEYTQEELRGLLKRDTNEFAERAQALKAKKPTVQGEAAVVLTDGRRIDLRLEGGRFWVHSAGLVPRQPKTPELAVEVLREAVAARDFTAMRKSLTPDAQEEFSRAFEHLDKSLEQLATAIIDVRQDRATIEFLDGRVIALRLVNGVWRVEKFE